MKVVNLFFVFLAAPLIGVMVFMTDFNVHAQAMSLPLKNVDIAVNDAETRVKDLQKNIDFLYQEIVQQEKEYQEQQKILQELANRSHEQRQLSDQVYEERILAMLGPPIKVHQSNRVQIKVFKLDELGYRGYIAKVKLYDPTAFKVALAKNNYGESETTSAAVARTGAILGINGGGFYSLMQNGKQYVLPIGNTVIDGKVVGSFQPSYDDIFFAGIRKDGKLIGSIVNNVGELTNMQPWQGVSFVPILIQDGRPLPLPKEWQRTKQPRTIIGEYANGDLILIVVDGRQSDWSSGVTLERLQIKLIELGVKEGYNLDGGGSSVFVYNGEILNRPSDGQQRKTPTNIVILP